ncbi:hypothetical protein GYMLUDRAFT_794542 [Collybiopsis luxurians FD-317 M1]|nr:hypothetical protein GYMLUDRAFT_794542 [Collybiopsis luxurians FD-317 M1]
MASPVNPAMASGSSQINSSDQSESDNSPRTHHVLSMLSGFANQYLSEWGLYPGMAQDMESLRVENAALKKELLISSTDVKKLWQDNEALDRHAKALVQERDALKFRVDVHTQDPHSLQTLCLNLKQENDELRRKHVFLAGNIERLVNDGLQLGYLVKSPANNDCK